MPPTPLSASAKSVDSSLPAAARHTCLSPPGRTCAQPEYLHPGRCANLRNWVRCRRFALRVASQFDTNFDAEALCTGVRSLSVLLRLAGGHGPPVLTLGPSTSSASLLLLIRRASYSRHSPTCSPRPRAKGRVCASCAGVARHMLTPRRDATRACCDAWRVGCRDGYVPAALPLTARMPAAAEPQSGPS